MIKSELSIDYIFRSLFLISPFMPSFIPRGLVGVQYLVVAEYMGKEKEKRRKKYSLVDLSYRKNSNNRTVYSAVENYPLGERGEKDSKKRAAQPP